MRSMGQVVVAIVGQHHVGTHGGVGQVSLRVREEDEGGDGDGTTRQRTTAISRPHRQRHSPSKLHPLTWTGNPASLIYPHRTPEKFYNTPSPSTPSTLPLPLPLTPNGMCVRFGRLKSMHHPMALLHPPPIRRRKRSRLALPTPLHCLR